MTQKDILNLYKKVEGYNSLERFTEAAVLGAIADAEFARACRRLRLDPSIALLAPLEWIVMASVEAQSVAAH